MQFVLKDLQLNVFQVLADFTSAASVHVLADFLLLLALVRLFFVALFPTFFSRQLWFELCYYFCVCLSTCDRAFR